MLLQQPLQRLVAGLLFLQRRFQGQQQGVDAGAVVRERLLGRCGVVLEQACLQFQQLPLTLVLSGKVLIKPAQGFEQRRLRLLAFALALQAAAVEGPLHLPDTPAQAPLFVSVAGGIGFEQQEGEDAPR